MAAPTLQAQGATATGVTTGAPSVTIPTHQANDIIVVTAMIWAPNTTTPDVAEIPTPANYTLAGTQVGQPSGSPRDGRFAVFWRRVAGAGTTVTLTRGAGWDTGSDTCYNARAYVIRGCRTSGNPFESVASSGPHTASDQAFPAVTVNGPERMVVQFGIATDNLAFAMTSSGWTTGTEDNDAGGTDSSFQTARKDNVSSSTSADTATVTAPAQGAYAFFGLAFTSDTQAVAPDSVGPVATLGDPTLSLGAVTVIPDTITAPTTLGEPTIAFGQQAVIPDTISALVTLGEPTLSLSITVIPDTLGPVATLGDPTLALSITVQPDTVGPLATLGQPALALSITVQPDTVGPIATFGEPTITSPKDVTYSVMYRRRYVQRRGRRARARGMPHSKLLVTHISEVVNSITVIPDSLDPTITFGNPTIYQITYVIPDSLGPVATFGDPTIYQITYVIPDSLGPVATLGDPTLALSITVQPDTLGPAATLGNPTIYQITYVIPDTLGPIATLGDPTIYQLTYVQPNSLGPVATFGNPTIYQITYVIPDTLGPVATFGNPTIYQLTYVQPNSLGPNTTFGDPVLVHVTTVVPDTIPISTAFGNPTLQLGAVTVIPDGLGPNTTFGIPLILSGQLLVQPNSKEPATTFGDPTLVLGAVTVEPNSLGPNTTFGNPTLVYITAVLPDSLGPVATLGAPTLALSIVVQPDGLGPIATFDYFIDEETEVQITASADDCGADTGSSFSNTDAQHVIGYTGFLGFPFNNNGMAARFVINLPQGTTIVSAVVSLEAGTSYPGSEEVDIELEQTFSPAQIADQSDFLGRFDNFFTGPGPGDALWDVGPTVEGQRYETPDLSALVQSLVDDGNVTALNFGFHSKSNVVVYERFFRTYDHAPASAPILTIRTRQQSPLVIHTTITVSPDTIPAGTTIGTPTLQLTITVQPNTITAGTTFGLPVIAAGAVTIIPDSVGPLATFGEPTLVVNTTLGLFSHPLFEPIFEGLF